MSTKGWLAGPTDQRCPEVQHGRQCTLIEFHDSSMHATPHDFTGPRWEAVPGTPISRSPWWAVRDVQTHLPFARVDSREAADIIVQALNQMAIFRREVPRTPGLYWFKLTAEAATHYCRVWRQARGIEHGGKLVTTAGDGVLPVGRLRHRWWAGPLPEPKSR